MRKFIFLLFIIGNILTASAQKKITEGIIEYEITYSDLSTEAKKDEDLLPKDMKIYFKDQKARIEVHTVMGPAVSITNNETKESYVLMDMLGKKVAMKTMLADAKKIKDGDKAGESKVTITKETKTILGYKCKKAIITTTSNGKQYTFDCYFTEQLPVVSAGTYDEAYSEINGCMLLFSMNQNGMTMVMKAKSIKEEKMPDGYFVVPSEYTIITQQQATDRYNSAK